MMHTHYAAPWAIIRTESAVIGERAILDSEGYTVCNPSPMGAANAALIAAAPELLDVCLAMLSTLDNIKAISPEMVADNAPESFGLNRAREAIARATGAQ